MNILLVDDDYYVIAALQKKFDWKLLGIETVYTANNVAQARGILENHPVQILISDIEMPQGSGLELLAWIREQNYSVQTILLTNYADFNYAQKAIELQSFEYFLKPIEFDKLMLIIQKAIVRAKEQQINEQAILGGYFWQKNQSKNLEHFWRRLVSGSTSFPLKQVDIIHAIKEQNLCYQMNDLIQPILFNVFPHIGSMGKEEKDLFDFALLNLLYELLQSSDYTIESILEFKDYNWIAILKWNERPEDAVVLQATGTSFIQKAVPYLKCDACCNIGLAGELHQIGNILKQLLNMDEELTRCRNQTYLVENYLRQPKSSYTPPDLAQLEELLNQNRLSAFLEEAIRYLRTMLSHKSLDTSVLGLYRLDIVQLVYSFLKQKGIQVHKLYARKANDKLLLHSLHSIEDMEEYLKYLVNTAMEYRDFVAQRKSIVEEIKQYIHEHYGDDLTRNDLSEIVYLNPDYLARLFKRETGISLGSYVIQVRIAAAKHLLETTNLSVYIIASKTGYTNYSYFSKLFKQEVGLSPNEYKKILT
ncbi:response regulator [Paenibacillus crassostreae]|uniref:AraC family transcriptional regulator n=1 Tax=Paenibacillus crassostreae TaxID=1763538 RepID=A0A167F992_9BACL|nr:response regulator [Paenibacillus crassostreae]AOZ90911.1 DNA-binding response regulator [Paenibacillus crassostreae]OAB76322.1 AraC family transcriptional regulator [Paenibacillus crassostreae]